MSALSAHERVQKVVRVMMGAQNVEAPSIHTLVTLGPEALHSDNNACFGLLGTLPGPQSKQNSGLLLQVFT